MVGACILASCRVHKAGQNRTSIREEREQLSTVTENLGLVQEEKLSLLRGACQKHREWLESRALIIFPFVLVLLCNIQPQNCPWAAQPGLPEPPSYVRVSTGLALAQSYLVEIN